MNIRLLNKFSNKKVWVSSWPSAKDVYKDFVKIPEPLKYKDVIWDKDIQEVVEKTIDIEALRISGLTYYIQKTQEFRAIPFEIEVNKLDETTVIAQSNLLPENLSDLVLVMLKAGDTKKVNIVNATTGLNEVIEVNNTEVERVKELLTEKIDTLTELDVKVSNKIKTADNHLVIEIFTMNSEQLEQFAGSIMVNASSILLMTDEEFDIYIETLIGQIKGE
jgi:hypothetical protein